MAARHKAVIQTPHGLRTCFEVRVERKDRKPLVARFGGIPLKRRKDAVINDRAPGEITYPRKELITRLLKGRCEICERKDNIRVHHIRKLADLERYGSDRPFWAEKMVTMRRKALVVCNHCHNRIHTKQTTSNTT